MTQLVSCENDMDLLSDEDGFEGNFEKGNNHD